MSAELEAVYSRRDGERTHAIERVSLFGVVSILMVSALAVVMVPPSWLQSDMLAGVVDAVIRIWPKLDHDVAALQVRDSLRGTRYALFVIYCGMVTGIFSLVMAPVTWRAIRLSSERLTYHQSSAIWKVPVALIFLVFWLFFETLFFGSNASVARAITRGGMLWFWTALLWGAFAMTLAAAAIVVAKLWTHGTPENSYEYNQRIYRRPPQPGALGEDRDWDRRPDHWR